MAKALVGHPPGTIKGSTAPPVVSQSPARRAFYHVQIGKVTVVATVPGSGACTRQSDTPRAM